MSDWRGALPGPSSIALAIMVTDWTHRIKLRNLQLILSLAETGNISRTASDLYTTQPGLSKWLKELEGDVGVTLFERHARGLRPTPHGEALIAHARRIIAHLNTARDEMSVLRDGGRGLVTVGFSGVSGVDTVPMAVLEVLRQLPETHVRLLEGRIEALVSGLSSGLYDIVVGPTGSVYRDPLIAAEVLYEEPIHLVCRTGHRILELAQPKWADVLSYPWALWARGTPVRNAFDQALIDAAQRPPVTYVESNAATLSTTLLIHSDMIGVASLRPALRYQRMNMLRIIPLELSATSSASMYWRTDALNRPAVAAAVAAVREAARAAE